MMLRRNGSAGRSGEAEVMLRAILPGVVLILVIAGVTALAYPDCAGPVARAIGAEHCTGPCNRVTGVAIPPEANLADLFLHHPPSVPTR
jgi:hypothetical protein